MKNFIQKTFNTPYKKEVGIYGVIALVFMVLFGFMIYCTNPKATISDYIQEICFTAAIYLISITILWIVKYKKDTNH